jgi:hypothetical protein
MDPWLVPSALAALLTRRIEIGEHHITPRQLTEPAFVAELPASVRDCAAHEVIKRVTHIARHRAALRARPVREDLQVPADFGLDGLTPLSRASLETALNGDGVSALESMTWWQLLEFHRASFLRVPLMTAMAELEWRLRQHHSHAGHLLDNDTAQISELLADDRIDQILNIDLRFGWRRFGPHETLSSLLRAWESGSRGLTAAEQRLLSAIHRSMKATLAEDVLDIGHNLAEQCFRTADARSRATEIFAARYGAREYGPQLEAIGKRQACSGSRVSQIVAILLKGRGKHSIASPATLTLLRRVESLAYLPAEQVERAVGLVPGQGESLLTLRRFCLNVLRPTIGVEVGEEGSLGAKRYGVLSGHETPTRLRAALRHAKRESRIAGAANIASVAGALALDTGAPVRRKDLEEMVDELPQAVWLDREHGWFAVNDLADSLIYSRVRKMLAVAANGISIREIGEALWRDAKFADESGSEAPLAPMRILKQAILSWPDGIKEDARGCLFDPNGIEAAQVLSSLELQLFTALVECGGVATVTTLLARIGGMSDSLRTTLSYAVFAYALGNGVYALRGWPVSERDLLAALADKVLARGGETDGRARPKAMSISTK